MKKIAVVGSQGRMGKLICDSLNQKYNVVGIDKYDDLEMARESELVIDFSSGSNSVQTAIWCKEHKTKLIIGATGQSQSELKIIEEASKQIPIMKAGNFSQGIVFLKKMLKIMHNKDIENISIIEMHHKQKKDSPSGTAIELAKTIETELGIKPDIFAVRGGEEIGTHEIKIYFGSEVLTISHQAFSRNAFAQGVMLAAKFMLKTNQSGLYSFDDLL